jgi:hypothetical protein
VLSLALNITIMVTGYLLVMGYLALGLRILHREPAGAGQARAARAGTRKRGWPALIRQVLGTAVGGYLLLMAVVVAYYHGVAGLGGRFLMSAATGSALLLAVSLPAFFLVSWAVERHRRR